jgi:hypothetical protein
MIKWIKNLFCKIIGIKQCQCPEDMDEHVEYFTKVPEPEIPVHKPEHCSGHTRFRKSCPLCLEIVGAK